MKVKLLGIVFCLFINTNSHSMGFDIYSNPMLTSPILATSVVSRLRNANVEQMDQLMIGECRQFRNYVFLSTENWTLAKYKQKSLDEAERYSSQLIHQIPYQQSSQYTFPFGNRTYVEFEKLIKNEIYNNPNPLGYDISSDIYQTCLQMNSMKYFLILSSNQYLQKGESVFRPLDEVLKQNTGQKSVLIGNHVTKGDTLSPPNMEKKINFTEMDYLAANSLIREDLSIYFDKNKVRWVDYRKIVNDVQSDFEKFMKQGGTNKVFAKIAARVKAASIKTDGFKNLEIRKESILAEALKNFDPETEKEILKKFNYHVSISK